MFKINYDSESFRQCNYSTLSQGIDNLDLAAVANEFVLKRNAALQCCADEISQNLQKELFLGLINNHTIKCTHWCFFEQLLPPHDYGIKISKKVLPTSLPLLLSPPTNKILYRGPCSLLIVNKVLKVETPMLYYFLSIFKYMIVCSSSIFIWYYVMYHIIFIWFASWTIKLHQLYPID